MSAFKNMLSRVPKLIRYTKASFYSGKAVYLCRDDNTGSLILKMDRSAIIRLNPDNTWDEMTIAQLQEASKLTLDIKERDICWALRVPEDSTLCPKALVVDTMWLNSKGTGAVAVFKTKSLAEHYLSRLYEKNSQFRDVAYEVVPVIPEKDITKSWVEMH